MSAAPAAPLAPAPRSFLAFDYGTKRVGVAAGNSLTAHRAAAAHCRGTR